MAIGLVLHPGNCKQSVATALAIFHETTAAAVQSCFPVENSTVFQHCYSVNGGSYQIWKLHFLQKFTLKTQQLMVIRSHRFYELWLNGSTDGKQKAFTPAKGLRWQHKLVQNLSELFFVMHRLLKIYLEKDMILY